LVIASNCIADLLLLEDEQHLEQRGRARSRIAGALNEIDGHLSGVSFGSQGQDEGSSR
jgi:hypothetical protein